jgi:hypothetical protein
VKLVAVEDGDYKEKNKITKKEEVKIKKKEAK